MNELIGQHDTGSDAVKLGASRSSGQSFGDAFLDQQLNADSQPSVEQCVTQGKSQVPLAPGCGRSAL